MKEVVDEKIEKEGYKLGVTVSSCFKINGIVNGYCYV